MCDFLHCNRCFVNDGSVRYALSSCFHVFCEKCVRGNEKTCLLCQRSIRCVPINSSMNADLKELFMDPQKIFEEELVKVMKKMEFQKEMNDHLLEHLIKEKERKKQLEIYAKKKGKEYEKKKKEIESMDQWIKMAEKKLLDSAEENQRLTQEINFLKDEMRNSEPSPKIQYNTDNDKFRFDRDVASEISSIGCSSNSTFNLQSPFVSSPVPSNDELVSEPFEFQEADFFAKTSQNRKKVVSDTSTFSSVFNSMFTPSRNQIPPPRERSADKTSLSLGDRTLANYSDPTEHRRETSLPVRSPNVSNVYSQSASKRKQQEEYIPERERRFPSSIRELRRYASQPGVITKNRIIPPTYLDLNPNC